jgi:pyrimidine-nucleoside phosphorylase
VLRNAGPADTRALTLELGAEMLLLGRRCKSRAEAVELLEAALRDRSALAVFRRMVEAQGGDARSVDDPTRLPRAKARLDILAPRTGFVSSIDALALGVLAIELGAGRTRADQHIDPAAGFELHAKVGERVARGARLVTIHAAKRAVAEQVRDRAAAAFSLASRPPRPKPLVLARVS